MKITIDQAGRVVIPKALRNSLDYTPGTVLEITPMGDELRLRCVREEPTFIEKEGILVHHGESPADINIADFIQRQRATRGREQGFPEGRS